MAGGGQRAGEEGEADGAAGTAARPGDCRGNGAGQAGGGGGAPAHDPDGGSDDDEDAPVRAQRLLGPGRIPPSYLVEMAGNGITTKKSIAKHWKELGREGQSQVVAKYEHELPLNFKLAPRWWVDAHCVEGSVGRQRKKEAKAQWKKMSREEQDATRADARSSKANGARGQKKATQGRAVNGGPSAPPAAFCAEQRAAACPSVSAGPPVGCVFFFTRQFSRPARRATGLAACARASCRITI